MAEPTERTPLDVHPFTLSFGDATLEREYAAAWSRSMLWPIRGAGLAGIALMIVMRVFSDDGIAPWWRGLPAIALIVALLVMSGTSWGRRNMRTLVFGFAFWAPVGVTLVMGAVPHAYALRGLPTFTVYVVLTCTLLQLGFARSTALVAAFAVAVHRAARVFGIEGVPLADGLFLFYATSAICLVAANINERRDRRLFVDERLLANEKARNEERLAKELSHQVAERSRELGAVLAKSDVTLDARVLREGERFAERYKIVRALGAGAMGAVYEVERVTDSARLALKCVVGEVSGASAARFAREAEIGARVRHPNLVSIVDVGVSTGVPYLVMEIVNGGSLEAQRPRFGDVAWALPILRQIAEGLAALHDAGVVHRDLKPANVLLDDGVAKISDFGISRFGSIDDSSVDANASTMAATPRKSAQLTGTGVVMGTPLYMAPEAARSARQLDASADVFALGIMAHEMLTGRSPFTVPAFVLAMAAQPIAPVPPVDDARIPPALRALVATSLSQEPANRPRVRELVVALAAT